MSSAPPKSSGGGGGEKEKVGKLQMLLDLGERFLDLICSGSYDPTRDAEEQLREMQQHQTRKQHQQQQQRRRRQPHQDPSSCTDEEGEGPAEDANPPSSVRLSCVPSILLFPPKPYQLEGLNWLVQLHERKLNGMLADEMGLGKTYQTIALLAYLKEAKGFEGPHLILAPKSTIGNWMRELRRFCPSLSAVKVLGEKEKRRRLLQHLLSVCRPVKQQQQQRRKQRGAAAAAPRSRTQSPLLGRESNSNQQQQDEEEEEEEEEQQEEEDAFPSQQQPQHQPDEEEDDVFPEKVDVVVVSYEMLIVERNHFARIHWEYIIIDEAHRIKNEAGKLATTVRQFESNFRLLLTGTPLQAHLSLTQNNLRELWALLHFLLPQLFDSGEDFLSLFDLSAATDAEGAALTQQQLEERNLKIVARLHRILRPFMLRRVKKDVLHEMPPKKELICFVPLSDMQRTLYRDLLTKNVAALQGGEGAGRAQLRNLAVQLRKACNHPYLFEGYEPPGEDPFGEHVILNSGKLRFCDRLLRRLIAGGSRCLLFSQMTRMLDILEDYCRIRGFAYCRLDGATSTEDREKQIEAFNKPGATIPIFLLSTRAGGLGTNLTAADTVILYDSDWNPQADLQAMDRAHRIGQQRAVNVYRLVHEHTVEEKVLERASLKLQLDSAVIQHGRLHEANQKQQQLSQKALLSMVQFGAEHIFKPSGKNDLTEEELDAILARGQERTEQMQAMLQQQVRRSLLDFSSSSSSSSSNLYEADDLSYPEERKAADREAWAALAREQLAVTSERDNRRRLRTTFKEAGEMLQHQQYHQQQLTKDGKKPIHIPRVPKLPTMQEWQFYRRDRLEELHALDLQWRRSQGKSREPTEAEREEKRKLLAEGFRNWGKRDLIAFVRGNEMYGRHDLARIATELEGKTEEEVRRYAEVFWKRLEEISDWQKLLKRIEDGEAVIQRRRELEQVIVRRQLQSDFPWRRLPINFSAATKGKSFFTDEEDTFILNLTTLLGYGNWEKLRCQVLRDSTWRFDWFFRSRAAGDIGRRAEAIIRQLKKEEGERFSRGRRRLDMPATKQPSAASAAATGSPPAADVSSWGGSGLGRPATPAAALSGYASAALAVPATETGSGDPRSTASSPFSEEATETKKRRLLLPTS